MGNLDLYRMSMASSELPESSDARASGPPDLMMVGPTGTSSQRLDLVKPARDTAGKRLEIRPPLRSAEDLERLWRGLTDDGRRVRVGRGDRS